ncbi:Peroxiredoxin OsmC [Burkholderiales bacterium]|nr:Peroxiredoxin OsmC [Burkholderiales bacterium]
MQRTASARWRGGAQEGAGTLTTQSATLKDVPFTFNARFGDGKGTNPEELIAVAHAGCFSMALSFALGNAGFAPESIETQASLTLDKGEGGFSITAVHLTTRARVPDIDAAKFQEIANGAKAGCPVSKVLKATITLDASLAS